MGFYFSLGDIGITCLVIIIIIIIIIIIYLFRKCMSIIPGDHEVKELQKTAILGTAHILRKVLT
jgi:flagellar biogenesis protein FliO